MLLALACRIVLAAEAESVDELLRQAQSHYSELEYSRVIPVVDEILQRPNVSIEIRLEAHRLDGSTHAVLGNVLEAERAFRLLLRARPEFELPEDTSPKIAGVFRKVQAEEAAIRDEIRQLEFTELVKTLALDGDLAAEHRGGKPIEFSYRVRDPRGAVVGVAVRFRRAGEPAFSSLALKQDETGAWRGSLPGEWTASPQDYDLQYFARTSGPDGVELIVDGSEESPNVTRVRAGSAGKSFYQTRWFWTAAGVATVAVAVATFVAVRERRALPDGDLEFRF